MWWAIAFHSLTEKKNIRGAKRQKGGAPGPQRSLPAAPFTLLPLICPSPKGPSRTKGPLSPAPQDSSNSTQHHLRFCISPALQLLHHSLRFQHWTLHGPLAAELFLSECLQDRHGALLFLVGSNFKNIRLHGRLKSMLKQQRLQNTLPGVSFLSSTWPQPTAFQQPADLWTRGKDPEATLWPKY